MPVEGSVQAALNDNGTHWAVWQQDSTMHTDVEDGQLLQSGWPQ